MVPGSATLLRLRLELLIALNDVLYVLPGVRGYESFRRIILEASYNLVFQPLHSVTVTVPLVAVLIAESFCPGVTTKYSGSPALM